ncbi:MAG: TIGR02757 family protein [Treponema sp.]|nr:TIGR02757 family protein [Treponema sp.]
MLPLPRKRPTIPAHKQARVQAGRTGGADHRSEFLPHLGKELNRLYRRINRPEFILQDPVQFPRRYANPADQEIAAFLASAIAWGRRDLILRSAERLFALMSPSPSAFVMTGDYRPLKDRCIHRTFFEDDLAYFCRGFRACYERWGSLEALFASAGGVWEGIARFRETMAQGNGGRYTKHIANPGGAETGGAGSACKRLNLALRWLVRQEGPVDLGLWRRVSPASLFIPLDVHAGRAARRLGLLERKSNDRKAVVLLTERLREFCPDDPVKYDFALFGLGLSGDFSRFEGRGIRDGRI